jgi:hypothetical protein
MNARRQRQDEKEEEGERPLNRFTMIKTLPTRPVLRGMRMQRSVSCHNWHDQNDE